MKMVFDGSMKMVCAGSTDVVCGGNMKVVCTGSKKVVCEDSLRVVCDGQRNTVCDGRIKLICDYRVKPVCDCRMKEVCDDRIKNYLFLGVGFCFVYRGEGDSIKVFLRVRPPENTGVALPCSGRVVEVNTSGNSVTLLAKPEPKMFTFDHVADINSTQVMLI